MNSLKSVVLCAVVLLITLTQSGEAATIRWAAAVSGNWNDANMWSPPVVPGAGDTVFIEGTGNFTVTVNVPTANLANLMISAFNDNTAILDVGANDLVITGGCILSVGGKIVVGATGNDTGSLTLQTAGTFCNV